MLVKRVDELVRSTIPLYFLYYSYVDEALYDIVWYGPLMVAVFTIYSIYICLDHVHAGKLMNI